MSRAAAHRIVHRCWLSTFVWQRPNVSPAALATRLSANQGPGGALAVNALQFLRVRAAAGCSSWLRTRSRGLFTAARESAIVVGQRRCSGPSGGALVLHRRWPVARRCGTGWIGRVEAAAVAIAADVTGVAVVGQVGAGALQTLLMVVAAGHAVSRSRVAPIGASGRAMSLWRRSAFVDHRWRSCRRPLRPGPGRLPRWRPGSARAEGQLGSWTVLARCWLQAGAFLRPWAFVHH